MEKEIIFIKRKKSRELYFEKKWSIRKISKYLSAGRDNVSRWVKMDEDEVYRDNRGWAKHRFRKYTEADAQMVINIREELIKEESYFWGDKVVRDNFIKQTGKDVSRWFVAETLRQAGIVQTHKKKKKGGSKYMMYPVKTINKLGSSMMSIDFIGPRYLKGSSEHINFLSCKYIRPTKEGIVKKIAGQTTTEAINILKEVWEEYYVPQTLKIDNDSAFGGNLSHPKSIGRLTLLLLNIGVNPLYIAPRSPWNNAEVEGFNNVFAKKFWNKLNFSDEKEIDIKIKDFNLEYEKYTTLVSNNKSQLQKKKLSDFKNIDFENRNVRKFKTKDIYFLRIVRRKGKKEDKNEIGFINILGEEVILPKDIINLFVFCRLSIADKKLIISIEDESGQLHKVKLQEFEIKNIQY